VPDPKPRKLTDGDNCTGAEPCGKATNKPD
jgi:hypothetical protein